MKSQIELAKIILENAGYSVTLEESVEKRLSFKELIQYPYQFRKNWKSSPNSTYGDDFLELAERYNCIQIKYNDGYNNTKFICKSESDYQNLKDALDQNKTLRNFISLSEIKDIDWDSIISQVSSVYVDRYSGGYSIKIPKQKMSESSSSGKNFKVGDVVEWEGLYGGHYKGKIKKITDDEVILDVSWIAEDTGNVVHADETRKLEKDSEGNDTIIVWEYHGEKGRVYPPSNMNESTSYIDNLLRKVGGWKRVNSIIEDAIGNSSSPRVEGDIYGVAEMTYHLVEDKLTEEEWEEVIEYVW